jgi:NAD+ kinase
MTDLPRLIGVVALDGRDDVAAVADKFGVAARSRGLETVDAYAPGVASEIEVLVGIGGDGTLLRTAQLAHEMDVPVIGVNLGTVGYLAEVEPENIDEMLRRLAEGELDSHSRMTVAAITADGTELHGINDVVLDKVLSQRLVQIAVDVNDEYFTTFRSDGLIIATPLGSTAYSLSAGGPVVDPDLDVLIMTPVAPHSLMSRPIVFTPATVLRFVVATERQVRLNVDGRSGPVLNEGESVTVRAGERPVRFLTMGIHPFPQAVRHQFGLDHA